MLATGLLVLLQAGGTPAAAPASGAVRTPPGWDDFPVFVWREQYAGKPLPEELVAPFGGVILMREEDSTWARERGLAYLVWNVAGRNALHLDADEAWQQRVERWIETHDEKLLVRDPCLNDPKTIETLHATLDATIAKHGAHPGLGFVLGDEVSLTPNGDPFDLCRCGLCEAKWKEYAKENGLPERAPLTDEVLAALDAGDFSSLGPWLARRRFDKAAVLALLETLPDRIHARPGFPFPNPAMLTRLPVGLLGINGPSAFGSIDLAGGLPHFDFVEYYPVHDAREMLLVAPERERRSAYGFLFARPRATLATVLVQDETPDSAAWLVWEHWLRGGNALVLWSDRALAQSAAHVARLGSAIAQVRRIERRFPGLMTPLSYHVALVQDADSIALSWLKDALPDDATWPRRRSGYQEEHGTRERSVRAWLRLLEDQGVLPGSVPLSRLKEFGGYDTLILSHVLVLGAGDVATLEREIDRGATLIVDGPLGWVDRDGRPWSESVFDRLKARAPGRVRTAPADIGDYLDTRLDRELARPLVDVLEGVPAWKPTFSGEAGRLPWLVSVRMTSITVGHEGAKERLVTALLNFPTRAERARLLRPLRLELEPPPDCSVEWIHPSEGAELPAGDAAVFVLHSVEAPR